MVDKGCRDYESRHLRMYSRLAGMIYDINFPNSNTQAQLCDLRARLQAVGLLRRLQAAGSSQSRLPSCSGIFFLNCEEFPSSYLVLPTVIIAGNQELAADGVLPDLLNIFE